MTTKTRNGNNPGTKRKRAKYNVQKCNIIILFTLNIPNRNEQLNVVHQK